MAVNYTPLKSEYGFESPNFTVSLSGNITANDVVANDITANSILSSTNELTLENFVLAGSNISTSNNTNISFLNDIEVSGMIVSMDLTSTNIRSTDSIEIDSSIRVVIKNSPLNLNSYTTLERNDLEPLVGDIIFNSSESKINYYDSSWKSIGTGNLVINDTTITAATDLNITIDPQGTGEVIVDDLKINNNPTETYHATRKDYVDKRITALAIAFGV